MAAGTGQRWVVIGGGIAGLAFTQYALELSRRHRLELELLLLEANDRPGGRIHSDCHDGYLCERGPQGVLDHEPALAEVLRAAELADRWTPVAAAASARWVQHAGRLHLLPLGPGALLRTRLLTWPGKLRLLAEPFRRPPPAGTSESIAAFGRRRFGREAAARLLDPFVAGIFAGDAEALEMAACLPKIHALEQRHGSLVRGMRRERRGGRRQPPRLHSFPAGMEELPRRLAAMLGPRLRLQHRVASIRAQPSGGFRIELAPPAEPVVADRVVCCLQPEAAAAVLLPLGSELAAEIAGIRSVDVVSVHVGFEGVARQPGPAGLDGFGYLVPSLEPGEILGCLFVSTCFPGHAPAGRELVRFFVGGSRAPHAIRRPDADLVEECVQSLRRLTGVERRTCFTRVDRVYRAIPQYELGHTARLARIDALVAARPGLALLGAAYRGVSVADLCRNARGLAEQWIACAMVQGGERDAQHR